ncbi:unnamed protein product [Rotaria sp. Silwood2]|nr:unnamed protein product [Rotaria sp. Silwood2]CAF3127318.1 unnamed protein product [Rotaria sp. Silwood2]CAF4203342.1 unnamed protein product [Rotaria sp. Silwood2]
MSWFDTLIRWGKQNSTDHEHEQTINHDNVSELYVACFEGDLDRAHQYLLKTPFAEVNRRECNGSTALNAAVQCGHIEMIDLLLNKYGVIRHLCDNQGRTAYDLAKSNEIRRLFQRPTSNGNRFCEKPDSLEMFSGSQKNNKEKATFKRVETYGNLLYGRSFTGTTYRGLGMTSHDLQIYHWARENPDRYLQLNTFCSSTFDEPLAKMYADTNANEQQKQVLIIFNFLRPSVNAICLYQISNQLHSYSDFQDKQEVLIVSGIAFSVTNIEQTSSLITISMTHLNLIEKMAEFEEILIDEQLSSY